MRSTLLIFSVIQLGSLDDIVSLYQVMNRVEVLFKHSFWWKDDSFTLTFWDNLCFVIHWLSVFVTNMIHSWTVSHTHKIFLFFLLWWKSKSEKNQIQKESLLFMYMKSCQKLLNPIVFISPLKKEQVLFFIGYADYLFLLPNEKSYVGLFRHI